jgi:hypothetical protein
MILVLHSSVLLNRGVNILTLSVQVIKRHGRTLIIRLINYAKAEARNIKGI